LVRWPIGAGLAVPRPARKHAHGRPASRLRPGLELDIVAAVAHEGPRHAGAHHGGAEILTVAATQADHAPVAIGVAVVAGDRFAAHQIGERVGRLHACGLAATGLVHLGRVDAPQAIGRAVELDRVAVDDGLSGYRSGDYGSRPSQQEGNRRKPHVGRLSRDSRTGKPATVAHKKKRATGFPGARLVFPEPLRDQFIAFATLLSTLLTLPPTLVMAAMAATEISDAINTYSIAVAPRSFFINLRKMDSISFSKIKHSIFRILGYPRGDCAAGSARVETVRYIRTIVTRFETRFTAARGATKGGCLPVERQ
jgi:hypothetical protein